MITVSSITDYLEQWAPPALAEDYDNVGLLLGRSERIVSKILVSLDVTEDVVHEAASLGCELIVSHHPVLFRGLKKIAGQNYVARTVELAIEKKIGLYAIHTNLDNIDSGVNQQIAHLLGLSNTQILHPKVNELMHLTFFVPQEAHEKVLKAVHLAGAGQVGQYSECSFSIEGEGRFTPGNTANPTIGQREIAEKVQEKRIDVLVPGLLQNQVLNALFQSHPYEEVAFFITPTLNKWQQAGSGMIGELPAALQWNQFVSLIKNTFGIQFIKHTRPPHTVKKVAVCGGSGIFLLPEAISQKADVFITADVKYHEFFDADGRIALVDVGHYESEQFTSHLIVERLSVNFPNIAVLLSTVRTNPVFYA